MGKSEGLSTQEHLFIPTEATVKDNGWHGWLSDLQAAEKALSRALHQLHRPAPTDNTLPKGLGSATGPLPAEDAEQGGYPWEEWSHDIEFPLLRVRSASASSEAHSHTQVASQREFSSRPEIDNGDWSARPTRATTPTPDWPPILNDEVCTLAKKPSYPPPAPRPSQDLLDKIYSAKPRPCFNHYLLPKGCVFKIDCNTPRSIHNHNVKRCQRSHEAELTPAEIEALRFMAQSLRCKDGIDCTRENCYHGHQCQSTGTCRRYLTGGTCPFLPEEHPEEAKTSVKDNLIPVDDNRDKRGKIYTTSFKERHVAKHNPTFTATRAKATRTAPDKVASLVFNDLCQILGPDGQREISDELEDTKIDRVESKTSSLGLSLLD